MRTSSLEKKNKQLKEKPKEFIFFASATTRQVHTNYIDLRALFKVDKVGSDKLMGGRSWRLVNSVGKCG
jgi:hypothetical protein